MFPLIPGQSPYKYKRTTSTLKERTEVKEKEPRQHPSLHSEGNCGRGPERGVGVEEGEVRRGGDKSVPLGVGRTGGGTEIGRRRGKLEG